MNIKPISSPNASSPATNQSSAAQSARARAISMLSGTNEQQNTAHSSQSQLPVLNQNAVSAEEMGAIQPSHQPVEDTLTPPAVPESNYTETPESSKPQEDPALSRQFAQLARQERALRAKQQQQDQAFKAREADLNAKLAAVEAKAQEYSQGYIRQDQVKTDPIKAYLDAGGTYDELTQQLLNNSSPLDPRIEAQIQKQQSEINRLQKLMDERDNSAKQSQQQQYDAAVKQIRTDAQNLVKNDPNLESIRATGSVNDVVDLIVKTFNEDGVLMSVEEAAEEVENYLVEEAFKLSRLSKVQKSILHQRRQ